MENYIEEYIKIRSCLLNKLQQMIEVYLSEVFDPFIQYIITRNFQRVINEILSYDFPDFPSEFLPSVKIRMNNNTYFIEADVQIYLNKDPSLIYLGNTNHNNCQYDLYCRESWDLSVSHVFYARNGHEDSSFEKGASEPAAQYMMGIKTPLSIAYSLAVDEGYIS